MKFLYSISANLFETIGIFAGLSGCMVLLVQVLKEYRSHERSSLSMVFLVGWIFIYLFWAVYGMRFHAIALIITNSIALILQIFLLLVVVKKNRF